MYCAFGIELKKSPTESTLLSDQYIMEWMQEVVYNAEICEKHLAAHIKVLHYIKK